MERAHLFKSFGVFILYLIWYFHGRFSSWRTHNLSWLKTHLHAHIKSLCIARESDSLVLLSHRIQSWLSLQSSSTCGRSVSLPCSFSGHVTSSTKRGRRRGGGKGKKDNGVIHSVFHEKEKDSWFPSSIINTTPFSHQIIAICIGLRPGFYSLHNKVVWRGVWWLKGIRDCPKISPECCLRWDNHTHTHIHTHADWVCQRIHSSRLAFWGSRDGTNDALAEKSPKLHLPSPGPKVPGRCYFVWTFAVEYYWLVV